MRSVALDIGRKKLSFCEVANGLVVQRATVMGIGGLEPLLGDGSRPARIAIEACREAWHLHDELTRRGHEVLLVDTTRVRQLGIGAHRRKTDRIDAEVLARAVERGGIPLAHVLSAHRQQLRLDLSVRRALVETRAQYVVTIQGLMRSRGVATPSCQTHDLPRRLRDMRLSPDVATLIGPLVPVVEQTTRELVEVEQRLEQLCEQEPVIVRLTTCPGVGLIVAAGFVSVIDEAQRFTSRHQVAAYLGLVPSEDSSGDKRRIGAITKCGNRYARTMLIQTAWSILRNGPDDALKRWAQAVVRRRGKRIGAVALARRITGILWAMWRDGTVYDASLLGKRRAARHGQTLEAQVAALASAVEKKRVRNVRHARLARPD
jgi:transposase